MRQATVPFCAGAAHSDTMKLALLNWLIGSSRIVRFSLMKASYIRASLLRAEDGSAWPHHGICFFGAYKLYDLTCSRQACFRQYRCTELPVSRLPESLVAPAHLVTGLCNFTKSRSE